MALQPSESSAAKAVAAGFARCWIIKAAKAAIKRRSRTYMSKTS